MTMFIYTCTEDGVCISNNGFYIRNDDVDVITCDPTGRVYCPRNSAIFPREGNLIIHLPSLIRKMGFHQINHSYIDYVRVLNHTDHIPVDSYEIRAMMFDDTRSVVLQKIILRYLQYDSRDIIVKIAMDNFTDLSKSPGGRMIACSLLHSEQILMRKFWTKNTDLLVPLCLHQYGHLVIQEALAATTLSVNCMAIILEAFSDIITDPVGIRISSFLIRYYEPYRIKAITDVRIYIQEMLKVNKDITLAIIDSIENFQPSHKDFMVTCS